jgi:hypothetical protein
MVKQMEEATVGDAYATPGTLADADPDAPPVRNAEGKGAERWQG